MFSKNPLKTVNPQRRRAFDFSEHDLRAAKQCEGEGGVRVGVVRQHVRTAGIVKTEMKVDFSSPSSAGIVRYLEEKAALTDAARSACAIRSQSPASVDDPHSSLGTHPDLVGWFWKGLADQLPKSCQWVVFGTPVLVHPASGIIFGFAGGTYTYALRLPASERETALRAGAKRLWSYPAYPGLDMKASTLNLDDIGEEWGFGQFQEDERQWCLAAYEFAEQG